jgi:hypothetical protein
MISTYQFTQADWTLRSFEIADAIRQEVGWVDLTVTSEKDGITEVQFSCPDPEEGQPDPVDAMKTLIVETEPVDGKIVDEKSEPVDEKAALETSKILVADKFVSMKLKVEDDVKVIEDVATK